MEPTTFQEGTVLFEQGDEADAAYLVQDGIVEIVLDGEVIAEIERGTLFGEMALINDKPRAAGARTKTDATCIVVPKSVFNSILRNTNAFTRALIQSLIHHVRTSHQRTEAIANIVEEDEPEVQFFFAQKDGSYRSRD